MRLRAKALALMRAPQVDWKSMIITWCLLLPLALQARAASDITAKDVQIPDCEVTLVSTLMESWEGPSRNRRQYANTLSHPTTALQLSCNPGRPCCQLMFPGLHDCHERLSPQIVYYGP